MRESEILELKKSTSELKEAIISIVSILNKHQKGELYFGVDRDGKTVGQTVTENTLREISRTVSEQVEPKIFPKIKEIAMEGKHCVHVEFSGENVPYYAQGRAYVRVGDEDRKISAGEIERMILKRNTGQLRWDNQRCKKTSIEDIDSLAITRFLRSAKSANRITISGTNKILILKKLGFVTEGKLTNAAVVLFGKKPREFFLNAIVKCGRFKSELKEEFFDLRDIEGNLFDCIEKTVGFLKDHLRLTARIEGLYRKEKWEIPIEALREAIINALIHRDYFSDGFTYIKLYDDKIVISNPGKLPDNLKIEDLYKEHESIPRNPLLAETLYYTGLIDVWGRGIKNIVEMLAAENLPKPTFEVSGGHFRIIFQRPEIKREMPGRLSGTLNGALSGTLNPVLGCIKENPGIQANQISNSIKKPIDTVKKQIKQLTDKGLVIRKGSRKTGGYWMK